MTDKQKLTADKINKPMPKSGGGQGNANGLADLSPKSLARAKSAAPVSAEPVAVVETIDPVENRATIKWPWVQNGVIPHWLNVGVSLYAAPVAAQAQPDAIRHEHDWVQGPYITDTVGSGWCVRIDGTNIFADLNQYGCKGRVTFQIARGLASKEEAETALDEWLSKYVTAQQHVSGGDGLPEEPEYSQAWRKHAALYGHGSQHAFTAGWNAAKDDMLTHCVESAIHIAEEKVKAQQPVSSADQFREAAQMIEPSGNSGELDELAAFEKWVSQFDTFSDEYRDMGSNEYFFAGYRAALDQQDDRSDWCRLSGCSHKAAGSPVWNNKQDAETGKSVSVENQRVTQREADKVDAERWRTFIDNYDEYGTVGFIDGSALKTVIDAARKEQA